MALIIPPGFAQCVWSHILVGDSEPIINTAGLDLSAAGGAFEDAADNAFTAWVDNILPSISDDYTLSHVTLYVGQDGGPPLVVDSTLSNSTGGLSNAPLPQNCAHLVRKRTDSSGRRGRGRLYIPGVPEGEVDSAGNLSTVYRDAMTTSANGLLTDLETGVAGLPATPMVILHRSEGIGTEPPPTPVVTMVCETKIATQRRRLRP